MTRAPLNYDELFATLDAEQYFENAEDAAKSLGLKPHTYRWRLNAAKERVEGYEPSHGEPVEGFSTPFLPTDKMPTDELIEHMTRRYNKRRELTTPFGYGHPLSALANFCESSTILNSVSNPSSTTNM